MFSTSSEERKNCTEMHLLHTNLEKVEIARKISPKTPLRKRQHKQPYVQLFERGKIKETQELAQPAHRNVKLIRSFKKQKRKIPSPK